MGPARHQGRQGREGEPRQQEGHRRHHRHRCGRHPPGSEGQLLGEAVRQLRGRRGRHLQGSWRPYDPESDYHGTHVAGTIAAARNGVGVAGVAPGVKISAIKVSEPETSLFYAESVVCAFVFAADHGVEVTNNSYYVDPWMFNCKDDADQAAIIDAVGRAAKLRRAQGRGQRRRGRQLQPRPGGAAKLTDTGSPNDSTPVERTVDPKTCWDVPTQLPGTVTVAATGVQKLKSYYSNYGLGQIDVAAPGGDSKQVPELPAKNGNILSTMPGGDWAYLAGTSMASPHVAGVVALLKSAHPKSSPQEIQWLLKQQADNPGCPTGDADLHRHEACQQPLRLRHRRRAGRGEEVTADAPQGPAAGSGRRALRRYAGARPPRSSPGRGRGRRRAGRRRPHRAGPGAPGRTSRPRCAARRRRSGAPRPGSPRRPPAPARSARPWHVARSQPCARSSTTTCWTIIAPGAAYGP